MDIKSFKKSILWLILSNSLPLWGVLFLSWDIFSVLIFYWIESLSIGLINILKIKKAELPVAKGESFKINNKPLTGNAISKIIVPFFTIHYSGFLLAQGLVIFSFFSKNQEIIWVNILLSSIFILFSHYVSYKENFIKKEEYKKISKIAAMFLPYKRIFILQFTVILGAYFIQNYNFPAGSIVILVFSKVIFDILFHKKEHQSFENKN